MSNTHPFNADPARLKEILTQLSDTAAPIDQLDLPAAPGVYGWFLAPDARFGQISNPGGEAVYIGKSGNLAQREFDTHFAPGKTGFSTLRRSIGAILKQELALKCRPRGTGTSKTNYTNYRFDDAGEKRLSNWMIKNLWVGAYALDRDSLKTYEDGLIGLACPPLNLNGWANPDARSIRELRKACADEARLQRPR
jgi:hypothetical protein